MPFFLSQEQQRFEAERESIQQRASKQISDLQANLQRLQTVETDRFRLSDTVDRSHLDRAMLRRSAIERRFRDRLTTARDIKTNTGKSNAQFIVQ